MMSKIIQLLLLPLILAGVFFLWSLPRITSDYNFNTDELIYLSRSEYGRAFAAGDFTNPIWQAWGSYDQPQVTNYVYSTVPGDRRLIDNRNSPCPSAGSDSFFENWSCLGGKSLDVWPAGTEALKNMVIRARTIALGISSGVIASTYFLGLVIGGPVVGVIAAVFLGGYTFFRNLATMAMMDQILLLLLNVQLIITLAAIKYKKMNWLTLSIYSLISGLALSTKFNAAPATFITGFMLLGELIKSKTKRALLKMSLVAVVAISVFIVLNPFLWTDTIKNFAFMVSWRAGQSASQAASDPATATTTLSDTGIYTIRETLKTWNNNVIPVYPLFAVAIIGIVSLLAGKETKSLGWYFILSLTALFAYLPVKWNRYLLPVMPALTVALGAGFVSLKNIRKINVRSTFWKLAAFTFMAVLFRFAGSLSPANAFILILSTILTLQGALVTLAMLYGFLHPQEDKSTPTSTAGSKSFTLIVPVRDEAKVIGDTLRAFAKLNYPLDKYEVLIPVRADDQSTQAEIKGVLAEIDHANMRPIIIDGNANTKSYSLNLALHYATGNYVGVFDAEDEPHADLLTRINAEFASHPEYAAVQAPVQLINVNSTWYSALNSLEYYFWFQSVLPFLTKHGLTPLGGNTIFLRHDVLKKLGGWDETSLTEDADLGIRLAAHAEKVGIITDFRLATLEETPQDELGVVRQRSRWDQGYLQVLGKGEWKYLGWEQKTLAFYTLSQPIFRHLAFLNMFLAPLVGVLLHVNTGIALLSFIPTYFLIMQWGMYLLGLRDLAKMYGLKINMGRYLSVLLYFYPYQALLSLATFRALSKLMLGNQTWDKTSHENAHRTELAYAR